MWQSISKNSKIIVIALVLLVAVLVFSSWEKSPELVSKETALSLLKNEKIQKVLVKEPYIYFYLEEMSYKVPKDAIENSQLFKNAKIEYYEESTELMENIILVILLSSMFYLFYSMRASRKTQEEFAYKQELERADASVPKQKIQAQHSTVTFADVAGVEDVKEELYEVIDFLRHPEKYREYDISLPKGVLLVGPPGVGKTLIAKAVAGEANVPFFYQSAASFVQIYVGMGAKRVSELFTKAKEMAPSIIFIDEIDAVGKSRGGQSNEEREATLNQLLTEMDGFEESSGVMVIAATNKIEVLDEALLRAGRFDRRVHIPLPDFKERVSNMELNLKSKKHKIDIEKIARTTIGFNSAALATLVNEAALNALRLGKKIIDDNDIEAVKDKVLLGKHKVQNFSDKERQIQALYQAAKAVTASWLEVNYDKIGIISSNFIPHHNEILSKTILENELKVLLAGRIATHKKYDELFTNAKEDIKSAKILAHTITEEYAMNDEYFASTLHLETLLVESNNEVTSLLTKLEPVVEKVTEYLLEHESISPETTKTIINDIF
jgi:ATP-dependent metalloprotease FtsH